MRLWLALPPNHPRKGGNWVSACRLAGELRDYGLEVFLEDADQDHSVPEVELIHAFHAYKAGLPALRAAERRNCPLVVTLTGTDLHENLKDLRTRESTRIVLEKAAAIVALRESARDEIEASWPALVDKTEVISPAVSLPEPDFSLKLDIEDQDVVFLLVSGIRAVKRPWLPLEPLERLRKEGLPVRLLIAGAPMENEAVLRLQESLSGKDWAQWLGELERPVLSGLYRRAHILLNTSVSEGMSNALLEGMSLGLTPLVAAIDGNLSLVEPGRDGLIFEDEDQLEEKARMLIQDVELRQRLGAEAAAKIDRLFSRQIEGQAHLALYRRVLSGGSI